MVVPASGKQRSAFEERLWAEREEEDAERERLDEGQKLAAEVERKRQKVIEDGIKSREAEAKRKEKQDAKAANRANTSARVSIPGMSQIMCILRASIISVD